MFSLTLENEKGKQISLTDDLSYAITDIDGLYPPSANIITSELSLYDGSRFNSSKVNARQIDMNVTIQRNAEESRIKLYNVVKTKRWIRLRYKSTMRDVYVDGYVSDMSVTHFDNPQVVTISILCPEPFFKDANEIIESVSLIIKNFHFPCEITAEDPIPFGYYDKTTEINVINEGDVESGLQIEVACSGEVKNPTVFNRETLEFFGVVTTLQAGDLLTISTGRGNKKVQVFRDGEYINLFNYIEQGSAWLQLSPGDNLFTYEADDDTAQYMDVHFIHQALYEGV